MKQESPDERADRYRRAEEFIRRVLEVAPDLTEEQIENIHRASAGDLPRHLAK
jgi:Mn-dependent DtxR family transcriptional regulator